MLELGRPRDLRNTASTYHEVRTWKEEYQLKDKPLIPLRMVRERVRSYSSWRAA